MRFARKLLFVVAALLLLAIIWLWWNRPETADMSAYVPADSLIYLEANELPEILNALVTTDAWRELAPAAGISPDYGRVSWLNRLAGWTGIGRSDQVVFSRAQVAVTVLSFQAAEEAGKTLKISPRAALVAETHMSEGRVQTAVEKLVGDFARRSLDAATVERREAGGARLVIWSERSEPGEAKGKRMVAAVDGSVAVVGNDEAVVEACLAVRRGERPSLSGNDELKLMRERVKAEDALAFGYAPRGSAARIVEILAPAFVSNLSTKPQIQSFLASRLPGLVSKVVGSAAWSARVADGAVEDHYFLTLGAGIAERLSESLAAGSEMRADVSEVLPADTYQVSLYDYRNPERAWVGLNAALSTQVGVETAPFIVLGLEGLLKPYGIETPREFLRATGSEVATVSLESSSENRLLIASVRDRASLEAQVRQYLGSIQRTERVGGEEILISSDAERGAASFTGNLLLIGEEADVRRCLLARAENRTLKGNEAFRASSANLLGDLPQVTTRTNDEEAARSFINHFRRRQAAAAPAGATLTEMLARRPYSLSQTALTESGFVKKTRSSFGLFGTLLRRLSPGD